MSERRGLSELIDDESPVWTDIAGWAGDGANRILPITVPDGRAQLLALQMTTWSTPGAMSLHCGGILADHGWLKLLGTADLPSLQDCLDLDGAGSGLGVCAVNVLGGLFAINWGSFGGPHHVLWYWGLDTLDWMSCGEWIHRDLLHAALTSRLDAFYADLRWPGWHADVAALDAGHGITLTPPPHTAEGFDKTYVVVHPVPMTEVCRVHQLHTGPGGLFHGALGANRYPIQWTSGRHHRTHPN